MKKSKKSKITVSITNIKWEPYDQSISEEEFDEMLNERPTSIQFEANEGDDIDSMAEDILYDDDMKVKSYTMKVV